MLSLEKQLCISGIDTGRLTVGEHDGLTCAPVFVVNLRTVVGGDCTHGTPKATGLIQRDCLAFHRLFSVFNLPPIHATQVR